MIQIQTTTILIAYALKDMKEEAHTEGGEKKLLILFLQGVGEGNSNNKRNLDKQTNKKKKCRRPTTKTSPGQAH